MNPIRAALITGASSGIGRAAAETLAARGMRVLIAGRDSQRASIAADEIKSSGGDAEVVLADLSTPEGVGSLIEQATQNGPVDVLVNNAGVFPFMPTSEITSHQFDEVMAINVRAPFQITQALAPSMIEREFGRVINISSISAQIGTPGSSIYGASKAALEALTRAWAAEYGPFGVTVNTVAPGPTLTPGTAPIADALTVLTSSFPSGRPASPTEVGELIAYLASPEAAFLHGTTINIDGGGVATRL